MKKIVLLIIFFLAIGSLTIHAQEVKVHCTVELDGTYMPDSIYLGLFPSQIDNFVSGVAIPAPDYFIASTKNEITFSAQPGIYLLGCMAWKYAHAYKPIFIPPSMSEVEFKIKLNPQIVGWSILKNEIKTVKLRGDYNGFSYDNQVDLIKEGEVWKLKEIPKALKEGQKYCFSINGQDTEDLLNDRKVNDLEWLVFRNIYTGNEIIFDPAEYDEFEKVFSIESKYKSKMNDQLGALIIEMQPFEPQKLASILNLGTGKDVNNYIDSLSLVQANIEKKYDHGFRQMFIEKELTFQNTKLLYSIMSEQSALRDETKAVGFLSGEKVKTIIQKMISQLKELDSGSCLLQGSFVESAGILQQIFNQYPALYENYNLESDFFIHFFNSFLKENVNNSIKCKVLFQLAASNMGKDNDQVIFFLNKLKNVNSWNKYVNERTVNLWVSQINIGIGKPAPDFSVDLLSGKKINLGDYSGKFVFIDFWGSWCAPCRDEIPNIKKLYSSLSRDKLEIIGLAQDDETKLRNYIREQNIDYPNALAPIELLTKYGVSKFPTSYLINPKGKIVRIDVRGPDAMELIKEEIEDYFN